MVEYQKKRKKIIQNTESAIEGSDIKLIPYENDLDKNSILENEYSSFRNVFKQEDIIVTTFIHDLYRNLQKTTNFGADDIPASVRISYSYLPTLKGKEFKAGIVVLDDVICDILNINRTLFGKLDDSLKMPDINSRFYVNLLYVALSRFRDFITILYPSKYQETITPILGT